MTGMTVGQINEMTQGYPKLVRRVEKLERTVEGVEPDPLGELIAVGVLIAIGAVSGGLVAFLVGRR